MTADDGTKRRASRRPQMAAICVSMYPRVWRNRYGEEFLDLLTASPLTVVVVLDVVRGALDAHLHLSDLMSEMSLPARMRSVVTTTFAAWLMFCFAAVVIWPTTNDPRFDEAADAHPLVGASRWLATAGLATSLVVMAGAAVPLAVFIAWQACRRRDRVALALFTAPPVGVAIFFGYTAVLQQLPAHPVHSVANVVMTVSWLALGVTVAQVSGVGATTVLMRRTEYTPALLRMTGWAAAAATAAMSLALLAGGAYGVGIWTQTPSLFLSSNGVLATPLPLTWGFLLLVAVVATATATRASLRGMRALRAERRPSA